MIRENRESFTPRKFPAIRYTTCKIAEGSLTMSWARKRAYVAEGCPKGPRKLLFVGHAY